MNDIEKKELKGKVIANTAVFGLSATVSALTKHAASVQRGTPGSGAAKAGSAVGLAIANGTVGSSITAGTAIVVAKATAVAAIGVAALPYVAVTAAGVGIYKLWKKFSS